MLTYLSSAGNIALIIVVFSLLIFIHELGHFLAALAVGVRPERFFVGFDIFGLALKKEINGCVYGIGLLPLGGYVKLTGQSDDPREQTNTSDAADDYRNKPLWARALIISAGVIMNMLFGGVALIFMYLNGMATVPTVVGAVEENSSAYYAGLRTGDKIIAVDRQPVASFNKLREYIAINGGRTGAKVFNLQIDRAGEIIERTAAGQPNSAVAGLVMLGIEPAFSTTVAAVEEIISTPLLAGDQILQIGGTELTNPQFDGNKISAIARQNAGRTLSIQVKRGSDENNREPPALLDFLIPVAAVGSYDFGYSVAIGVAEVMENYPAQQAGLTKGDKIIGAAIAGEKFNLLSREQLASTIRARAYQPVKLTVRRGEQTAEITAPAFYSGGDSRVATGKDSFLGILAEKITDGARVTAIIENRGADMQINDVITQINGKNFADLGATVAQACCQEVELQIAGKGAIVTRPQINLLNGVPLAGIVMEPLPEIIRIAPDSAAEKFLHLGDFIIETIILPDGRTTVYWSNAAKKAQKPVSFATAPEILDDLRAGKISTMQGVLPASLAVSQSKQRESFFPALRSAARDTIDMSLTVYKLLHRLATREISAEAMSGPVGIIRIMSATLKTSDPFAELLKLLALISINLAVFNLLPFPVLDGGHLLFIIIEAVKGSPPGERVREITQYFGVVCLLALMLYVSFNDVNRLVKDTRTSAMIEYQGEK